jgi:hypothetical protein
MTEARTTRHSKLIKLGKIQIGYLIVVLFMLIPLTVCFPGIESINKALIREYFAPSLKRSFGFEANKTTINYLKRDYEYFAISYVKPGSFLERAGFKANDIPLYSFCKFNMLGTSDEAIFYNDLLAVSKGKVVTISVINRDDYDALINGKGFYVTSFRRIKLVLPSHSTYTF